MRALPPGAAPFPATPRQCLSRRVGRTRSLAHEVCLHAVHHLLRRGAHRIHVLAQDVDVGLLRAELHRRANHGDTDAGAELRIRLKMLVALPICSLGWVPW